MTGCILRSGTEHNTPHRSALCYAVPHTFLCCTLLLCTSQVRSGAVNLHHGALLMVELKGAAMSDNYLAYIAQQAALAQVIACWPRGWWGACLVPPGLKPLLHATSTRVSCAS